MPTEASTGTGFTFQPPWQGGCFAPTPALNYARDAASCPLECPSLRSRSIVTSGGKMTEDSTDGAERARIEALFRAPMPWYNNRKVIRRFAMFGGALGALLHLYFSYRH